MTAHLLMALMGANLTSANIANDNFSDSNSLTTTITFKVKADGTVLATSNRSGTLASYSWLISGDPTLCTIQATVTSGTLTSGPTTEQPLTVDQTWTVTASGVGTTVFATLDLVLRCSGTTIDTATVSLTAERL